MNRRCHNNYSIEKIFPKPFVLATVYEYIFYVSTIIISRNMITNKNQFRIEFLKYQYKNLLLYSKLIFFRRIFREYREYYYTVLSDGGHSKNWSFREKSIAPIQIIHFFFFISQSARHFQRQTVIRAHYNYDFLITNYISYDPISYKWRNQRFGFGWNEEEILFYNHVTTPSISL